MAAAVTKPTQPQPLIPAVTLFKPPKKQSAKPVIPPEVQALNALSLFDKSHLPQLKDSLRWALSELNEERKRNEAFRARISKLEEDFFRSSERVTTLECQTEDLLQLMELYPELRDDPEKEKENDHPSNTNSYDTGRRSSLVPDEGISGLPVIKQGENVRPSGGFLGEDKEEKSKIGSPLSPPATPPSPPATPAPAVPAPKQEEDWSFDALYDLFGKATQVHHAMMGRKDSRMGRKSRQYVQEMPTSPERRKPVHNIHASAYDGASQHLSSSHRVSERASSPMPTPRPVSRSRERRDTKHQVIRGDEDVAKEPRISGVKGSDIRPRSSSRRTEKGERGSRREGGRGHHHLELPGGGVLSSPRRGGGGGGGTNLGEVNEEKGTRERRNEGEENPRGESSNWMERLGTTMGVEQLVKTVQKVLSEDANWGEAPRTNAPYDDSTPLVMSSRSEPKFKKNSSNVSQKSRTSQASEPRTSFATIPPRSATVTEGYTSDLPSPTSPHTPCSPDSNYSRAGHRSSHKPSYRSPSPRGGANYSSPQRSRSTPFDTVMPISMRLEEPPRDIRMTKSEAPHQTPRQTPRGERAEKIVGGSSPQNIGGESVNMFNKFVEKVKKAMMDENEKNDNKKAISHAARPHPPPPRPPEMGHSPRGPRKPATLVPPENSCSGSGGTGY